MAENQRLEALGRLAGGVAHDFNNLLSIVLNYSAFIAAELGEDHPLHDDVQEIARAGERASALVHQLLLFSGTRENDVVLGPVAVDQIVSELLALLRKRVPAGVEVRVEPADALPSAWADQAQVEQAVLQLITNAFDALDAAGRGGTVVVRVSAMTVTREHLPVRSGLFPGVHVVVEVLDDGPGMEHEVSQRAFEPFYSTRGEGRGLGLATVRTAMAMVGGHCDIASEPGRGTLARLLVPTTPLPEPVGESGGSAATRTPGPGAWSTPGAAGVQGGAYAAGTAGAGASAAHPPALPHVVVCEDEPALRELARRVLTRAGYDVTIAGSADDAERVVLERGADLLVTDVMMPGRGGVDLARSLTRAQPDLKVLFVTGLAGLDDPGASVLRKPFTPAQLATEVRRLLTSAG